MGNVGMLKMTQTDRIHEAACEAIQKAVDDLWNENEIMAWCPTKITYLFPTGHSVTLPFVFTEETHANTDNAGK